MGGKLFISSAYSTLYVFVGDFFPTLLRNQSYGAASLLSRILTTLVPFLLYLGWFDLCFKKKDEQYSLLQVFVRLN